MEYLDLILIHAPKPWADYTGTDGFAAGNLAAWQGLEAAYQAGKVRAIGVANFDQADLQNLLDHGTVAPMVDQVLAHIGKTPLDLIDFAQNHDILVEAHSPFGHGDLVSNSDLQAIAGTYGVTVPQLAVRYLLQLGLAPLPKATSADHMRSNAAIDFVISDADMAKLKAWTGFHYSDETSVFPVYQK
ncbi:hypothetical protein FFIC_283380 [Fructobacillus ficulneus]|uniref:NADP-dependent oxidoreductase domain-containing protein n=1 Tax=Fructobacillus ficulneus TaxID=157463 RepID=A0A0K8MID8_9LACO|nr:hypothetical protein FFIC_283380 [Fructobacillus ficulneus]